MYRTRCEREGYGLDQTLVRAHHDYVKSCERGVGGPARPRALPLEDLWKLPSSRDAWHLGGPVDPRAAMMAGTWFLCREVELSTSRARTMEFSETGGLLEVTWHLPASKNDQAALGYARRLRCACTPHAKLRGERAKCIAHVLLDHVLFLRTRFADCWGREGPSWGLPRFPDSFGKVVAKSAMVRLSGGQRCT